MPPPQAVNLIGVAAMGLACSLSSVPAPAQTAGPFQPGLVLTAVQHCPRYPDDGVTLTVRSVTDGGTAATVGVKVKCWGATHMVADKSFIGSLRIEGKTVDLTFFLNRTGDINESGVRATGAWTTENGKPVLTFGRSILRSAGNIASKELIFRAQ